MSTESLTFNFSLSTESATSVLDTPYVRLEQVLPVEETATLGEVAEILESLYTIDPCNPIPTAEEVETEEEAESEGIPPFSIEEFNTSISQFMKLPECFIDADGNWSTQIKVILSDPNLPYSLKLSNGIITQTILVKEVYKETITVEASKGILLSYPIVVENIYSGQISFQWNGSVLVNGIGAVPPPVTVIGNTLYWGEEVTGSLSVEYPTKYFLVDVTVYGTGDDELGECSAICFYEQMVDAVDLQKPDVDEIQNEYCGDDSVLVPDVTGGAISSRRQTFYIIQTEWKCQCSGDHSHWTYSPGMTEDQRNSGDFYSSPVYRKTFGGYVDCGETDQDISTDEFYIENCCYPPEFDLPECATVYRKNNGGYELDPEVEASLVAEYGDQLQIVYVMPEDGECGRIITEQELNPLTCCDEVTDIEWSEDNPEVLPADSNVGLSVSEGTGHYTWRTTSNGTFFSNGSKSIQTTIASVILYADLSFCGGTSVSVTDGCSNVSEILRSSEGEWVVASLPDYACGPLSGQMPDSTHLDGNSVRLYKISGLYKQEDRLDVPWDTGLHTSEGYPKPGDAECSEGSGDYLSLCLEGTGVTPCSCLITRMGGLPESACMLIPFNTYPSEIDAEYCFGQVPNARGWKHSDFTLWSSCLDSEGTPYNPRRYKQTYRYYSWQLSYIWEWRCIE